jgi:hypothetical protein
VRGTEPTPAPTGTGSWPGRKQLVRRREDDLLCLDVEAMGGRTDGEPLLVPFVLQGERVRPPESADACAARARSGSNRWSAAESWPLRISPALEALAQRAPRTG